MTHIWVFSWVRSKLIHRPLSTLTRHFKSILHRSLSPHIGCFHTRGHRLLSTHIGHFSFKKQPILHRPLCTKHRPLSYKHRLLWLNIGRFDIGHFHTNIGRFSSTSAAFNCTRLVAPSIQYIRQNLDILPGKGHQMIFPWILIHALSFMDLQQRQYLWNRFKWFCWGRILIYAKTLLNLGDSFRSKTGKRVWFCCQMIIYVK